MKKLIFLFLMVLIPMVSLSISYTSFNNHFGYWNDVTVWTGSIPNNDNINLNGGSLTLNGFVKWQTNNSLDSTLTFSGNNGGTITINDTLIIYGNLEISNKYNLLINGILIVYGNITTTNTINITTNGFFIVSGDMNFGGSKGVIKAGTEQNVYIGGTCNNGKGCVNTSNDSTDLINSNINVYNFYHRNNPTCPITGPTYYVPNLFRL